MRFSTIITLLGAGLTFASPMVKKALVVEVVTDIVYTTVTENIPPSLVTTVITLDVIPTQAWSSTSSTFSTSTSTSSTTTSATPSPDTPTPTPTPMPTTEAPPPTTEAAAVPATSGPPPAAASTPNPSPVQAINAQASPTDYISAALYHHNVHRANHSAEDVTYDATLASKAATLAATCVFQHDMTIGGGGYGQNLYANASSEFTAQSHADPAIQVAYAITAAWYYGEVDSYTYYGQDNPGSGDFGHFTQVVWAGSNKIGCATQFCPAGTIYPTLGTLFTVCDYSPEGNVVGYYKANVMPSQNHAAVQLE